MKFGLQNLYGLESPWGLGQHDSIAEEVADFAVDRLLVQSREQPNMVKLVGALARRHGLIRDVLRDLLRSLDLGVASAHQLDILGAIVGLPRMGHDDVRYRTLLRIEILLILADTDADRPPSTAENMIAVFRTFLGEGPSMTYKESYPAQFSIEIDQLGGADQKLLISFAVRAKGGGIGGHIHYAIENPLLGDGVTTPVDDPNVPDGVNTPIDGAGLCSHTVELHP